MTEYFKCLNRILDGNILGIDPQYYHQSEDQWLAPGDFELEPETMTGGGMRRVYVWGGILLLVNSLIGVVIIDENAGKSIRKLRHWVIGEWGFTGPMIRSFKAVCDKWTRLKVCNLFNFNYQFGLS